jgi:hypothetical protein
VDHELSEIVRSNGPLTPDKRRKLGVTLLFDEGTHEIEIAVGGEKRRYQLKPLTELYGKDRGVDIKSDEFVPLLAAIEEQVVLHNLEEEPSLSDGPVLLIMKQLGMDPDHEPAEPLGKRIHGSLRLCLSLNEYSPQNLKSAFRQISKSIQLHTSVGGTRGYVSFIREFFGK